MVAEGSGGRREGKKTSFVGLEDSKEWERMKDSTSRMAWFSLKPTSSKISSCSTGLGEYGHHFVGSSLKGRDASRC